MSPSEQTSPESHAAASAGDLSGLLLDLLGHVCVTGEEGPIADWLAQRYAGQDVRRVGHSLVVGAPDPARPTVLLVGHTDVVPPTPADRDPRVEGERIVGRGASDMKGGLAVAMALFEDAALRAASPYALRLIAYAGEEGPHDGNELAAVLHAEPGLADAALAIVLEPTDLEIQLGCLGALNARVTVRGHAAHAARPWQGRSAIDEALPLLADLGAITPVAVDVDGLLYREVTTVTQACTRNARNVVPDTFELNVNVRFAPGRTADDAVAELRRLVGGRAELDVVDAAPSAVPSRHAPAVQAFLQAVDAPVSPKQAWTDVARFTAVGVPALNYGPGLTGQAHQPGEYIPTANLGAAERGLRRFLAGSAPVHR